MSAETVLDVLDRFCSPISTFWRRDNDTLLSNESIWHDQVDITLCFTDTAVFYSIAVIFWICTCFKFICGRSNRSAIPFNYLNLIKIVLCLVLMIPSLANLGFTIYKSDNDGKDSVAYYQFLSPIVLVITMLLAAVVVYFERRVGVRSSSLMTLLWLTLIIYGGIKLRTLILISLDLGQLYDTYRVITFCVEVFLFIIQMILALVQEPKSHYVILRTEDREPCPEEIAPFFSRITWWWQNSLFWKGFRNPLTYDDLYDIRECDKSLLVARKFELKWRNSLDKSGITFTGTHQLTSDGLGVGHRQGGARLSIIMALISSFGSTFFVAGIFKFAQDLLNFVGPLLLKFIVNYVEDPNEAAWKGYFYASLMFLAAVVQSILLHQYFHRGFVTGMRIRTAVIAAVYKKALLLSNSARHTSTVGEIVNLMSVDAQRLMDLMPHLHMLWSAPFQIVLSVVFLYQTIGSSVYAGLLILLLLIPINAVIMSISSKYQVKKMTKKDARIKLINEILDGIKVIKLYAWEVPFKKMVSNLRIEELKLLRITSYLTAGNSFIWTSSPFIAAIVTFATYSVVYKDDPNNRLTADKAFVALSLFYLLRFPLIFIPLLISSTIQANVSLKRLGKYLFYDELDPHCIDRNKEPTASDCNIEMLSLQHSVSVVDGSFAWEKSDRPVLQDINLTVKPGELIAIVGQVGAGKSSLISALLGEMDKINGHVSLRGSIAYVPQQAWIQNATVKDNILFGKQLNTMLYDQTLQACALEQDLEILPGGDMTEIGEKGINLSGGQKQRVSLARSVYQQADVYLLDDPLSAVDSHVGKHIFNKVIGPDGILNHKVRLLVTHSVNVLPQCDRIVVMDNGRITESGTYSELINQEGNKFAEFLQFYTINRHTNEEESIVQTNPTCIRSIGKDDELNSTNRKSFQSSLTSKETAMSGNVKLSVLLAYIKACTYTLSVLTIVFYTLYVGSSMAQNFWLASWSNTESVSPNDTNLVVDLGVYSIFGVTQVIFVLVATFLIVTGVMNGSRTLHDNMLSTILRSPMSFFDTTPLGRILNRFSKDIDSIDERIPLSLQDFLMTFTDVIATVIIISVASPWFLIIIIPLSILYYMIQRFYVTTSRQLNRLNSISNSPIFSHFKETLTGATSIRAYEQTKRFIDTSEYLVDYNNIAYYPFICSKRWLAIRLEFLGNLIILFAAMFAALQRNYPGVLGRINPGLVGLSLSYALQITQSLNWVVRMTSDLESDMVSVERTKEFSEIQTEADDINTNNRPPINWPTQGNIRFKNYSARYREELDFVIMDITVDILPGQKVGIVGRTGAGKSSLTLALFRIIESARGSIFIDGIDIATIGLRDLRSRITIIPQDPVLFSGTLHVNLDPFDSHTDDEIWFALETSHLSQFVNSLEAGLEHNIAEGGDNISVGQRQLVCLARALLRKTKILILDEATAAVDMETDDLIQKTIRKEFADATVITIAHRLNTIMDYDRILVLDNGHVAEFDTPNKLLEERGVFYGMAKDANLI